MNLRKITQKLWHSPGMPFAISGVIHFSLGFDLRLSYCNGRKRRIHIPTNGAKLGFSGSMGDYMGVKLLKVKAAALRSGRRLDTPES
jgi:hypothetical protein